MRIRTGDQLHEEERQPEVADRRHEAVDGGLVPDLAAQEGRPVRLGHHEQAFELFAPRRGIQFAPDPDPDLVRARASHRSLLGAGTRRPAAVVERAVQPAGAHPSVDRRCG